MADLLGDDLVNGNAGAEIRALRFLDAHASQEGATRATVVARTVWAGGGGLQPETAEHLNLIFDGVQGFHRLVELEVAAFAGRPPFGRVGAVGELEERETQRRTRGRDSDHGRGLRELGSTKTGHE